MKLKSLIVASLALVGVVWVSSGASARQTEKESDRLENSATVLKEIFGMPDAIPQDLLDKAECVIVFPSVKKVAFGVGGSYGRGVISCRGGSTFDGGWSAPAMFALEGASIGFQLGAQATDFVLLVMNDRGANSVLGSKVKLGADASAAAGPKGRNGGRGHRHRDAGRDPDVLASARALRRRLARGVDTPVRRRRQRALVRPEDRGPRNRPSADRDAERRAPVGVCAERSFAEEPVQPPQMTGGAKAPPRFVLL